MDVAFCTGKSRSRSDPRTDRHFPQSRLSKTHSQAAERDQPFPNPRHNGGGTSRCRGPFASRGLVEIRWASPPGRVQPGPWLFAGSKAANATRSPTSTQLIKRRRGRAVSIAWLLGRGQPMETESQEEVLFCSAAQISRARVIGSKQLPMSVKPWFSDQYIGRRTSASRGRPGYESCGLS